MTPEDRLGSLHGLDTELELELELWISTNGRFNGFMRKIKYLQMSVTGKNDIELGFGT